MESARWLPIDEGKLIDDLDRLKRAMKNWAKANSVKDRSWLGSLSEEESAALMQELGNVVLLDNGQLPLELATSTKSSMLLLNALVTYYVYTRFFKSAFFFLEGDALSISWIGRPDGVLEQIYACSQEVNEEDAHLWRSQTLRLLMPPVRKDSLDAEKQIRRRTEDMIANAADK